MVELTLSGADGAETWSVVARLDAEQLSDGSVQAAFSSGAISKGLANLTLRSKPAAVTAASGGALKLSVATGRIRGTAETLPAELATSIEGDVVVSCWVPRSMLGEATSGGTTDSSGSEALVEDVQLSSAPCKPLRSWRR